MKKSFTTISGIYGGFRSRMNQGTEMLKAFPAYKSMRYNKHLQEFRQALKKLEVVKIGPKPQPIT